MITALIAEKGNIKFCGYIDDATNTVKFYLVLNYSTCDYPFKKFFSYTKAKSYYDELVRGK